LRSCSHRGLAPENGEIERELDKFFVARKGEASATWHYTDFIDPKELKKQRIREKMYLARYGHLPLNTWDDMDVVEMRRHLEALSEIVKEAYKSRSEDD
jgi:hypothetical protein